MSRYSDPDFKFQGHFLRTLIQFPTSVEDGSYIESSTTALKWCLQISMNFCDQG